MDNKLSTSNNYPNNTKGPTYLIPNEPKQRGSRIQIILPNLQFEKIDLNENIGTSNVRWIVSDIEGEQPSTDSLAFYSPFHNNNICPWGIYIYESGIIYLANVLKILLKTEEIDIDFSNTVHKIFIINMVLMKFHLHESFHHAVEVALTSPIEPNKIIVNNDTYLKYDRITKMNELKQKTEEKFCNSFVANNKKEFTYKYNELTSFASSLLSLDAYPVINKFMKSQPKGYKDFTQKSYPKLVAKNLLETIGVNLNALKNLKGDPAKLIAETITNTMQEQNRREIPHYLIHDI